MTTTVISAPRPHVTSGSGGLGCQLTAESLANAAHDMRGPLAVILGHLELLRHPRAEHSVDVALEAIHRNAERMASTVAIVLDGEQAARTSRVNHVPLRPLVTALADDVAVAHPGRVVRVVDGIDAAVGVDRSVVERVLANLLRNAVIHTPPSTVVRISIDRSPDHRTVSILVVDDGGGIAPGDRDRIFERHQRGDTDASGSGLGLAISRDLARESGGDLVLRDTGDRGCCFELRLPVVAGGPR